jgi:photosystem II stability/assembly factor-like uncharacterized protein
MKKIFFFFAILGILSLNNSYSQYIEQVSGVTTALRSAYNLNSYTGIAWICGDNGVVLRTTNNGTNWLNVSRNGIPSNAGLVNISCTSGSIAVIAGYIGSNTYVYRTTNSGANWTQVFLQVGGFIDAIYLSTNSGTGFMYGDPVGGRWSLWKTTNSGANWDSSGLYLPQSSSEAGWNNAMIVRNNHIWFGTNNSRIYHSRNFGVSWTPQSTAPELNSYAIWMNYDTCFGYVGGNTLLVSSNCGMGWIDTTSPGTGAFGGFTDCAMIIDYPPPMAWFVRSDDKLYENISGGPWSAVYTAPAGTYTHISPYCCGYAFAVRSNGGITRLVTIFGGVKKISSLVPDGFKLYDNYPNPFNPSTRIKFSIPPSKGVGGMYIWLIIYDALGREIETLVNEKLSAGTYEVEWSAEKYTSGIYFYRLTTDGYSVTKKMVLIK